MLKLSEVSVSNKKSLTLSLKFVKCLFLKMLFDDLFFYTLQIFLFYILLLIMLVIIYKDHVIMLFYKDMHLLNYCCKYFYSSYCPTVS